MEPFTSMFNTNGHLFKDNGIRTHVVAISIDHCAGAKAHYCVC